MYKRSVARWCRTCFTNSEKACTSGAQKKKTVECNGVEKVIGGQSLARF